MKRHERRKFRNYFINKEVQTRIFFSGFLNVLLIVVLTLCIVQIPSISNELQTHGTGQEYAAVDGIWYVTKGLKILVPVLIVFLITYMAQLLLITHRVCGPLVNFSNSFQKVREGDLSHKIRIRRGDLLHKECDRINEMLLGVAERVSDIRDAHIRLAGMLEDISNHVEEITTPETSREVIERIRLGVDAVGEKISHFTLEPKNRE